MTMQFEVVEAAITSILGAAEAGRFRTIGHQSQSQAAESFEGSLRTARVYYGSGAFPKGSGARTGPTSHDTTFNIELAVAESAKVDLSVLDSPTATAPQKAAALLAASEGDLEANKSWNELARIVYQILMDARNQEFGLDNQVADRWVERMQKDNIGRQGGLITITGVVQLTLRVTEQVLGDTGTPLLDTDTNILVENQPAIAGVKTTFP